MPGGAVQQRGLAMVLGAAVERQLLHARDITLRGYLRTDGLLDIEARLVDTKPEGVDPDEGEPGKPLHEMWVRMTVDQSLVIVACESVTVHGPYAGCAGGGASMGSLAGLALKPGFLKHANERLRGVAGCTHIRELLQQMATVAHQAIWPLRSRREEQAAPAQQAGADRHQLGGDAGRLLNTCIAYASDGEVVRARWPRLYTGSDTAAAPQLSAASPPR